MFPIQRNGVMGVGGLPGGVLHTRLSLGVFWKLGSCTFKFVLFQTVCHYTLWQSFLSSSFLLFIILFF